MGLLFDAEARRSQPAGGVVRRLDKRVALPSPLRMPRGHEKRPFGLSLDVLRCRKRDMAFKPLVDAHKDALWGLASTLLPDRLDPEDAVQETFQRAVRGLPEFEGEPARRQERAWLKTTCYRICIDRLRRSGPEPLPLEQIGELLDRQRPVSEEDPERVLSLWEAIEGLPAELHALVKLFHAGISITDIARTSGVQRTTVDSRFRKACRLVRERLDESLPPKEGS